MKRKRTGVAACIVAASLVLASTQAHATLSAHGSGSFKLPTWFKVASIATFLCAGGIISAAMAKNSQQNKQLTKDEAFSCGWRFWVKKP